MALVEWAPGNGTPIKWATGNGVLIKCEPRYGAPVVNASQDEVPVVNASQDDVPVVNASHDEIPMDLTPKEILDNPFGSQTDSVLGVCGLFKLVLDIDAKYDPTVITEAVQNDLYHGLELSGGRSSSISRGGSCHVDKTTLFDCAGPIVLPPKLWPVCEDCPLGASHCEC